MAWFSGSTSDYRDLLAKLAEYASSDNVTGAVVSAGGSGYVVGEVLTVSGGTASTAATLEVTGVSGGAVTSVAVVHAGAYTAQPSNPASTTASASGTGCTLTLTFQSAGWTVERQASQIHVVGVDSITNPGSGYMVGDTVTIDSSGDGDTTVVTEATLRVDAVSGGAVTALSVLTNGEYSAASVGVGIATTGGSGSGLEIDPLFDGEVGEDVLILEGSGSGSDEIVVGVRTYTVSGIGATNWELAGFTSFTESLPFVNQPGISPGRHDNQTPAGGQFLPLRDVSMSYWMSISSSSILLVVRTGTNYQNAFMGFIDRLSTESQYPYPMLILAPSSDPEIESTGSNLDVGGLPDPIAELSNDSAGPGVLRKPDGTWEIVRNGSGTNRSDNTSGVVVWPPCDTVELTLDDADDWAQDINSPARFEDGFFDRGDAPASARLEPTPDSGGALAPLFELILLSWDDETIYGQVPGAYWTTASRDGASSLTAEDTVTIGSQRYRLFPNVYRTQVHDFLLVEEA